MRKQCKQCHIMFEGRRNKDFCSISCKSFHNNELAIYRNRNLKLSFDRIKANKNVVTAQAKLLEYQQNELAATNETDLLNSFYEFRYKLKQYNNFFEKRKRYEELIQIGRAHV